MQPHDRVNFGGLCFACSVFLSRASRGVSLSSAVPFIVHRGRRIHPFARLVFRFMLQRTRHINVDLLVSLRFVSFPGLKNEAYICVLSWFRRAFSPFHSFTMLPSTRGEK